MVSIKGIDKAEVLRALYNASQPLGMGILHFTPQDMTKEEAAKILKEVGDRSPSMVYFDYLQGRVMKVNLTGDEEFEEWLYDRDNGKGAAQRAIDSIK